MKRNSTKLSRSSRGNTDQRLKHYREVINNGISSYQVAVSSLDQERKQLKLLRKELKAAEQTQKLIQDLSKEVQQKAHTRIAAIVSKCLTSIWGEKAYEFRVEFEKKRNKTEAYLVFYRDGHPVDPLEAAGGGAVDIASFALRIARILFSRPRLRKFVIMDEPFKHLHPPVIKLAQRLLDELSKELDMQFVVITHSKALRKGKKPVRV